MLPTAMEGRIEDSVELNLQYPSVSERYWTKYYFIPKDRRRPDTGDAEARGEEQEKADDTESNKQEKINTEECKDKMEEESNKQETEKNGGQETGSEGGGGSGSKPDSSGHVCVMVHTNKLCLVTLSPRHPALAQGRHITQVSYDVGKCNRLDNQVSGKGKRGAQMMGPQSPVCIITCSDGTRYSVLSGVHGKLVEVNERLVDNPKLVSQRPDAEGYLAVILPPLRNSDTMLKKLLTTDQYQELS